MTGIHALLTKPIEVHAAEWRPDDPVQRALVLGWLWTFFEDEVSFEIGTVLGGLHLDLRTEHVYVPPGAYVVLDPVLRSVVAVAPDDLNEGCTYDRVLSDPGQPDLLALID